MRFANRQLVLPTLTLWAVGIGASAFADEFDIKPGQWEITATVEMQGMPMSMPPMTRCLTRENATDILQQSGDECEIADKTISGDTVRWSMSCKDPSGATIQGRGEGTFSQTAFDGTVNLSLSVEGQAGMAITSSIKGKWLGPCD
jgi:hypothetical protein